MGLLPSKRRLYPRLFIESLFFMPGATPCLERIACTGLEQHAVACLKAGDAGNDGKGSCPAMGSFLDNTGVLLPYVDC